ncbi:hypothetical protein [Emticicia sp. TH156]|uniref:hypothetical protein n=1 Tax=Emticicia sp. TH156 TaxID=2067454 RepID=UPI000C76FF99|nr:hypothetical protein [Emticicia sp. TH156]PLK42461.1 hypothetical protein C0V77_20850 [Emticicia sp. TH156]
MNFIIRPIIILLVFSIYSRAGDFELTPGFQKAYTEVFKYKIRTARNLLVNEKKDSPFRAYLESYIDMVELLNSDDEEYYERIKHREGERLDLI